jgi:D-glycero-D-manno-heptose 1,7-bisphosphate phosphatase
MPQGNFCEGREGSDRESAVKQKAIFLDRDGTIIKEKHYLKNPSEIELIEGAAEALLVLQRLHFKLVIVTNQSGIRRGFFTAQEVDSVHERLTGMLSEQGVTIDGIYYSPDLPGEGSRTRKPGTGLVKRAAQELGLSLEGSYCIGDKVEDIEMGKRKRLKTILVLSGYGYKFEGKVEPDYCAKDLLDAARWIQEQEEG